MRKLELPVAYPTSLTNFFQFKLASGKLVYMYVEWKNKRSFQRKTLGACENKQQTQLTYDPRSRIQMVYTPKRNMLYPYKTKINYKYLEILSYFIARF